LSAGNTIDRAAAPALPGPPIGRGRISLDRFVATGWSKLKSKIAGAPRVQAQ
jgi:hypothetical protein